MIQKGKGFQAFAHILMVFLVICSLAPFVLLLMSSFTEEQTLMTNGYSFFPQRFSAYAYSYLLSDSGAMLRAYGISFLVTIVGTLSNLTLTTLYAYPLSRKELPGRTFFSFFLFFTMLFSGGLVPSYIMWTRTFHVQNTLFALLIPNLLLSAFNVIMMRTYLTSNVPEAVIESGRIEGAGEFRILLCLVLPMAKPILATVALLVGLSYWNDWVNGLYYINNDRLYSVQVLLTNIQRNMEALKQSMASGGNITSAQLPSASVRMAITVLGVLPIMVIYPFLQKYFVRGITIGAVKG